MAHSPAKILESIPGLAKAKVHELVQMSASAPSTAGRPARVRTFAFHGVRVAPAPLAEVAPIVTPTRNKVADTSRTGADKVSS